MANSKNKALEIFEIEYKHSNCILLAIGEPSTSIFPTKTKNIFLQLSDYPSISFLPNSICCKTWALAQFLDVIF